MVLIPARTRRLAAILSLLAAASCASALRLDAPEGFLTLSGSPPGEFKATTHDGARLWAREFADPDGGTLDFWSRAVRHDFVERRGYEPIDSNRIIEDQRGRQGAVFQFAVERNGSAYGYLVAVFALGDRVRVVEFVAPRRRFDELAPAVNDALPTLR